MKFYCDKCQTKYSIAEEKVRGKVLKVRCKNCSHVITVREPVQPARSAVTTDILGSGALQGVESRRGQQPAGGIDDGALFAAAARARARLPNVKAPAPAPVSWHYAINGESFGPYSFEYLSAQFASARLGDAVYVWNENFEAWKPVREVAEFSESLGAGLRIRPAQATIGVSGGFQAIRKEDYRSDAAKKSGGAEVAALEETLAPAERKSEKKSVNRSAENLRAKLSGLLDEKTLENKPAVSEEFPTLVEKNLAEISSTAESVESDAVLMPQSQVAENVEEETLKAGAPVVFGAEKSSTESASQRLQRLRDRLKVDDSATHSKPSEAELALGDTTEIAQESELEARTVELGQSALAGVAAGEEITLQDPVQRASEAGTHDGLFASLGEATRKDDAAALHAASSAEESDFFGGGESGAGQDSLLGADEVPFLSVAPRLGASQDFDKSADPGYSGSLLIELDKFKKQRRSKFVWIAAAAVLLFVAVGGIVALVSSIETVEDTTQVVAQKEAPREIVFRRYSKEEQGRMRNLIEIPDEVIVDGAEQGAEKPSGAKAESVAAKAVPVKVASNVPAVRAPTPVKTAPAVDPFEAAMSGASSHNPVNEKGGVQRGDGQITAGLKMGSQNTAAKGGASAEDDRFKALAAIQMPSGEAPIYQPSDSLKNRGNRAAQQGGGLTDAQASAGFRTVRQSIGLCRERTMQRGLKIDAQKIYVTLEIQPSGKVSSYTVEPTSVRDTEFDRCMIAHTARWKFESYVGDVTLIKAPFILQ